MQSGASREGSTSCAVPASLSASRSGRNSSDKRRAVLFRSLPSSIFLLPHGMVFSILSRLYHRFSHTPESIEEGWGRRQARLIRAPFGGWSRSP